MDESDACTTDMFDPLRGKWDPDILEFVVGAEGPVGARKLEAVLGELGSDGGKSVRHSELRTARTTGRAVSPHPRHVWASLMIAALCLFYSSERSRRISSSASGSAQVRDCTSSFHF